MYQVWLDTSDPDDPVFKEWIQKNGITKVREGRRWPGGPEVLYRAASLGPLRRLIELWWDTSLWDGIKEVKGMRCFYLRDKNKFPVAAVVSELIPMEEEDRNDPVVAFAVSVCNPMDYKVFDKKRMRANAEARLRRFVDTGFVNRPFCGTVGAVKPKEKIMQCLVQQTWPCPPDLKENKIGYPRQVREAAAQWLWGNSGRLTPELPPNELSSILRQIAQLALQAAEVTKK